MHAEFEKNYDAADYTSADDENRAYRTQNSPKAKRKPPRQKAAGNGKAGMHKRRNNRWAW